MLRGAIESVSERSVSGWIHASEGSTSGRRILAFVNNSCVGAGEVSLYRKDLADAGLGDGYLGFKFPIALAAPKDVGSVVVRLEGSDAALLASTSRVVAEKAAASTPKLVVPRKTECLRWMRSRRWLEQHEYDYLIFLDQFGVYDRILTSAKRDGRQQEDLTPLAAAKDLLELHYMTEIEIETLHVDAISDLPQFLNQLEAPVGQDVVVGLHSNDHSRLAVADALHLHEEGVEPSLVGAVDYVIGPNHLLLLNARSFFKSTGTSPISGITVYFASRNPAAE